MKKVSLLIGALGGAMAGYVFSNNKLREDLSAAKDPEEAGKILAKHLQKDSQMIGKEIHQFVKSDAVQDNMHKAKKYAEGQMKKLKTDLKGMMAKGEKKVAKTAKKATAQAKKTIKKAVKKVS